MVATINREVPMTSDAHHYRSLFYTAHDGLRLHMRDYGPRASHALPVVCLPGLSRNSADFDVVARAMAGGSAGRARRVVALDYRGRGLSDWDKDWTHYDMRTENLDILDVLTGAGVGEAIFLGTSRGGLHTMLLSATRPAIIRAAILNDIGPVIEQKGIARIRGYVGKLPSPNSFADAADMMKTMMSAQFTALTDADWDAYARLTFEEKNGHLVARYDTALSKPMESMDIEAPLPTLWPQFEGLRNVPVLTLRGENSDLLSTATLDEMARRHPHCETFTVPGQGHAPILLDEPTIARISQFIAKVDGSEITAR